MPVDAQELEDIEKQLDRQFKKIDEINKSKRAKQGWIDREERRREQRIEKKIDRLLKQKDQMITNVADQNQESQDKVLSKYVDNSIVNKLDLFDEHSDSIEPADNPGDYGGKSKGGDRGRRIALFKPSEIKLPLNEDHHFNHIAGSKEPVYLKRYRVNEPLIQHWQFMRTLAIHHPDELVDLFVYVQGSKERDLWYRILLKSYNGQTRKFDCEYQNQTKTLKKLKLIHEMIIIDQ